MLPGACLVIEHKTASTDVEDGSPYWKRLRLDSQVSNYYDGARALGMPPDGVLYDVIRKPRIKPLKATPVEARKYTKPKSRVCAACKKKGGAASAPHEVEIVDDEDGDGSARIIRCEGGRLVTDPGGRLYADQREHDETLDEYRVRLRADIEANVDSYFKRGIVVRSADEEREAALDRWMIAERIASAQLRSRWPRNVDACERYGRFCDFFPVCTGEARVDDPTRYRRATSPHEELDAATKHRLPLVTTSGMKAFNRCAREYFFSYELGYRSIERAESLAFGTLVHVGLEVWWTTVDLDAVFAAMRASKDADPLRLVQAEELMRAYHARWCEEAFDVLAVEREFVSPLVDPLTGATSKAFALGGKIDAIARVGQPKGCEVKDEHVNDRQELCTDTDARTDAAADAGRRAASADVAQEHA